MVLAAENVATNSVIIAGYDENQVNRSGIYINANQSIDRIGTSSSNYSTKTGSMNGHTVTMANGAVLTMNATASSVLDHRFVGQGSIVYSPIASDCVLTFGNLNSRVHTMVGSLKVENGSMVVPDDTSFNNITNVEVGANGVLEWTSTQSFPGVTTLTIGDGATLKWYSNGIFGSLRTLTVGENSVIEVQSAVSPFVDGQVSAVIGAGSKLVLPEGVMVRFVTASVAGEALDADVYNSGNCDWIEGAGQVEVMGSEAEGVAANWDAGGGADTKFSTAANWQGDELPNFTDYSAQVKFMAGSVASVDTSVRVKNIAFVGVSEFELNAANEAAQLNLGSEGLLANALEAQQNVTISVPLVITKPQSWEIGEGSTVTMNSTLSARNDAQYTLTRTGAGRLVLNGEHSTWPGILDLKEGVTEIEGDGTLGVASADGAAVVSAIYNADTYPVFHEGVVYKPVTITCKSDNAKKGVFAAKEANGEIVFKEKMKFTGSTFRPGFGAKTRVVFAGGWESDVYVAPCGESDGEVVVTNKPAVFVAPATWQLEARPAMYFCVSSNKWNSFNASYTGNARIYCRAPWAFYEGNTTLDFATQTANVIYLGGYPQRFGTLNSTKPLPHSNKFVNEEERAAQLYLNHNSTAVTTTTIDFVGNIDLIKEGTGELTMLRAVSATGLVTVASGKLGFGAEGSWLGATNVICTAQGKLQIASGETFGRHTDVFLETGAELILDNAQPQNIQHLFIDGVRQPKITYTAANCSLISGTGALVSLGDGKGSCILLR